MLFKLLLCESWTGLHVSLICLICLLHDDVVLFDTSFHR